MDPVQMWQKINSAKFSSMETSTTLSKQFIQSQGLQVQIFVSA